MSTLWRYNRRKNGLTPKIKDEILDNGGNLCYYCRAAPATEVDHVIPYSYSENHEKENLVPACRDCNAIAGGMVFDTIQEKAEYIRKQLGTRKWQTRRRRANVCPDCGQTFAPGVNGATNLLCGRCAKKAM